MSALLQIEDLGVKFGAVAALKGVSLHLDQGEIVCVLGANGAGKSTLVQAIAGLVPVNSGTISLEGQSLHTLPAFRIVLKGVSLSPEGRRVFATLSVEENLNLGAYSRRHLKAEIKRAKDRVYDLFPVLLARRRQLAGTLSGGEQQMLAMGRALMSNPRVLLLDEPSLGLAPILVNQIFDIVRAINAQGTSILLIEQNAHKALNVAARGYVFENGAIAASGPAATLKADPRIQEAYLGGSALKHR